MNGTTFQCLVSSGTVYEVQKSSVGTLTVEETPAGNSLCLQYTLYTELLIVSVFLGNFETPSQLEQNFVDQIYLDHQNLLFYEETKIFEWRNRSSSCVSTYQITSTACSSDSREVYPRLETVETRLNISSSNLIHGNSADPTFFRLSAVDSEGHVCQEVGQYLVVQKSGIYSL